MKPSASVVKLSQILSWIIAAIIVLLPFHAFLTIWVSSWAGHYTLLRLWKEILLVPVFFGTIYLLVLNKPLRKKMAALWLMRLIGLYVLLTFITVVVALARHSVGVKAAAYGVLLDLRFLVFFVMAWVVAAHSSYIKDRWRVLLLAPAFVVAVFAILQYLLLPYNFLAHFGYSSATIYPYETINHNINYIRVGSTLRGANPLGAYLVLVLSAVFALLLKSKDRRLWRAVLGVAAVLALIFSFSRSAWLGVLVSLAVIIWLAIKSQRRRRQLGIAFLAIVIIAAAAGLALRNNQSFEDTFLHTDNSSQAKISSNQGHSAAFKNGVHDIVHQPLGAGPGTAGPASVYNAPHPGRIAENYYLQIGQEVGVLGIALFAGINVLLAWQLWLKRSDRLALALLASLVGISVINMLSHAWTDDTLAYLWWGLAGVATAPVILKANKRKQNEKTSKKPA